MIPSNFNAFYRVTLPQSLQHGSVDDPDTRPVIAIHLTEEYLWRIRELWYVEHRDSCDMNQLDPVHYSSVSILTNRLLCPKAAGTRTERHQYCYGRQTPGHAYTNDFVHKIRKLAQRKGWDATKIYVDFGKRHPGHLLIYSEETSIGLWIASLLGVAIWWDTGILHRYYDRIFRIEEKSMVLFLDAHYNQDDNTEDTPFVDIFSQKPLVPEPNLAYDSGVKPETITDLCNMAEIEEDALKVVVRPEILYEICCEDRIHTDTKIHFELCSWV